MAIDNDGNVYVCDWGDHVIRKIDVEGNVSTFAGIGEAGDQLGPIAKAMFNGPIGITIDKEGVIYVVDTRNQKIKKINADGEVEFVAGSGEIGSVDGDTVSAMFNFPTHICVDEFSNLYVCGNNDNRIRKIDQSTGLVSTFAGNGFAGSADGQGASALFNLPQGIAIDKDNNLYVGDRDYHRIRKITPSGLVTTIAGSEEGFEDGPGEIAKFSGPKGVAVDDIGNVYVADRLNFVVRKIDTDGMVSTVAGFPGLSGYFDGEALNSLMGRPVEVVFDKDSNLLITDWQNEVIR